MQKAVLIGWALIGLLAGFIVEGKHAGGSLGLRANHKSDIGGGNNSHTRNGSQAYDSAIKGDHPSIGGALGLGGRMGNFAWHQQVSPRQFREAMEMCQECSTGVVGFIKKLERVILSLPSVILKGVIRIPAKIVSVSIKVGSILMAVCSQAHTLLRTFLGTIFAIPARIMSKFVQLFMGFLRRLMGWGKSCEGQMYCQEPLPAINGLGPCGGQWPCTQTVACTSSSCKYASRALLLDPQVNLEDK